MKKRTFRPLVMLSCIVAAANTISAQPLMKPLLTNHSSIVAVSEFKASAGETATINPKALKNFDRNFKDVNNVEWFAGANGFTAAYKTNGYPAKSMFDKKGRLIYSVRQYNETELPYEVNAGVKRTYRDYTVIVVHEITVPGDANAIYLVLIQNKTNVKRLRIYDNEIEAIEDFKKGD